MASLHQFIITCEDRTSFMQDIIIPTKIIKNPEALPKFLTRFKMNKKDLTMAEQDKFHSSFVSSQFVSYIDRQEIKSITETLANTISQKYAGQELVVIGILKGCSIFMADLIREIKNVKIYVDFVKLKAIGRSKESHGTICITKDITTNIMDRNVLIAEEIIDTGRALYFLKKRLQLSAPRNIEIATLFDKPYKRAVPLHPEMIGKKIDDHFVVGYGLDLEEHGRNLEDLFYLKYPN